MRAANQGGATVQWSLTMTLSKAMPKVCIHVWTFIYYHT